MSDISIKVVFLGSLRGYLRRREMEVTLPGGSNVVALLRHLSQSLGEPFSNNVFDAAGRLSHQVSIMVDGAPVRGEEDLQMTLGSGQVDVMILPVFEGG